jgi:hypothetical protein
MIQSFLAKGGNPWGDLSLMVAAFISNIFCIYNKVLVYKTKIQGFLSKRGQNSRGIVGAFISSTLCIYNKQRKYFIKQEKPKKINILATIIH